MPNSIDQPKPRTPAHPNGRVIIAGPGRSGTTFIVTLLTELGFDTGFSRGQIPQLDARSHAGLEQGIYKFAHKDSPLNTAYIIKSPVISEVLETACLRRDVIIEHVYIPLREMEQIARSRERVSEIGGVNGGFWDASDVEQQRRQIARLFYTLMNTVVSHDLPHTFLNFPRLVKEPQYLYRKLGYLLETIPYENFLAAFNSVVRPDWVHSFPKG